ncbi:fructosamine kinase family protein [Vibrio viridaestus]|uniref:Fructosamine kinase family protein n=1 Tax=Vibrio viridaestus TaxID=2487322 RepID=A0A3N9TJ65_9VIBR|nr:fructosamine kinase family protein [Vibrio viridaestus]RQW63595.1 fructosamine kinase family protein [Vibrio viridaestus]
MWEGIAKHISQELERGFIISRREHLSGGDINEAYVISNSKLSFFVKVNDKPAIDNFVAESEALRRLQLTNTIRVPEVITCGTSKTHSFLVLEYIPCTTLIDSSISYNAGEELAKLHKCDDQKQFGFDQDNYIGFTVQPNPWSKNWASFFSEQRIGWQLQLLFDKGIVLTDIESFVGLIHDNLLAHNPKPSLLHGDLWTGNLSQYSNGAVFYDPASYWGDRECDIAMTRLFGQFPKEFYQGYEQIYPLSPGFKERMSIYNLYHILNHCNCFGGHYLAHAESMIQEIKLALTV